MGLTTTLAIVGGVVAAGAAVVGAAALCSGGSRNSSSQPRCTYKNREIWDEKLKNLQSGIASLESERAKYSADSNRFDEVRKRKDSLKSRLEAARGRLAEAKTKQREMEQFMTNQQKTDAVKAVQDLWEKEGNNAVDRLKDNCPRLDDLASDMGEIYNNVIEEKTRESFRRLESYRDEQKAEKLAKIKDHRQAQENRDRLFSVIRKLEQIQLQTR